MSKPKRDQLSLFNEPVAEPGVMAPLLTTSHQGEITVIEGDCVEEMAKMPENSIDAIVTDPPYALTSGQKGGTASINLTNPYGRARICAGNGPGGFMGKKWDDPGDGTPRGFQQWCQEWAAEALRILKPGGYMLVFGGTRTYHRMTCGVEDAGFEIRDCLQWLYGCLSADTEILIDGQWEPYRKATAGHPALCYDARDDTFSWQPIQERFEYRISDTAYRVRSDRTDQIVSRNHRCLVERGGAYAFEHAEALARQRSVRVPVLEDVSGLLCALPLSHEGAGGKEEDVLERVCDTSNLQSTTAVADREEGDGAGYMHRMRQGGMAASLMDRASKAARLLKGVQWSAAWQGVGETRPQGASWVDGRESSVVSREDERRAQSRMEGRSDVLQDARELYRSAVRALSSRVPADGSQRRLRNGASAIRRSGVRTLLAAYRGRSSRRPQPRAQRAGQPTPVRDQSGPQTVRASRFTSSDLAVVEPIQYDGVVWCVRVPTGAFVARRNGKVFVTGNSGFPKSLDVSKAIDKAAGAEREVVSEQPDRWTGKGDVFNFATDRAQSVIPVTGEPATEAAKQWQGFGTALKPGYEPIALARKPLIGTVAANVLEHGTGALNIDGTRVETTDNLNGGAYSEKSNVARNSGSWRGERKSDSNAMRNAGKPGEYQQPTGRWPANVILDEEAAEMLDEQTSDLHTQRPTNPSTMKSSHFGGGRPSTRQNHREEDCAGASRFFYTAKASRAERTLGDGSRSSHPTVKPIELMRWLVRLITPPGGIVLDPFAGSGSTLIAASREGFASTGIEKEASYTAIIRDRMEKEKRSL